MILPPSFYERDTVAVAKDLLGCLLVHRNETATMGWIVEVEAYLRDDPAAHSYRGETPRNRAMFGPAGHAYVYRIYGLHTCVNVVTGPEGTGEAVLVRALEPAGGIEFMQARRGTDDPLALASGPGKLTQALGITMDLDGTSLSGGPLQIWSPESLSDRRPEGADGEIVQTTRIGITKAADLPLRFYRNGSRYISRQ
ncbi:DNA-3-methyladenine glycosylase [Methanoculleus chikugoensis]|uniref:Putative 3-methyladenine DNA glycosylase n=1 Tax=Methanoculleus chikugoensis TaxID=118126 RepID=A0ABN5XL37_9EURY|nr:DNA-3-methyladenine glycosylase [Methanoculleus chikugoensis]BBL67850.1 putative 3-methyladenine DNA glycosylase [Methanoculleus chikugoensis]